MTKSLTSKLNTLDTLRYLYIMKRIQSTPDVAQISEMLIEWEKNDPVSYQANITTINEIKEMYNL